jgi:cyclopropane-fatty-acyl-phospholipid synthase
MTLLPRTGWPDVVNDLPRARRAGATGFALAKVLSFAERGRLAILLPSGARIDHVGARPGPNAEVRLHRWRVLRRLALQGDIGFAMSYVDGDWSSPDLAALIEFAALNDSKFLTALAGAAPFRLFNWLAHRMRSNTRAGSRRNIRAHYDLGNDFYRLWLDAKMIYSSAIYETPQATLEDAQERKLQRIVDCLQLSGGENVLELGCGWGALAARIAAKGARVTGVTLSPAQLDKARGVARDEELENRLDLRLEDYRDVRGRFDRIVSVEMIEAVGRENLPKYFEILRQRLRPGGLCVLQAITIAEERFADYCRRPDFIQRHIFPGGFLPTKTLLRETLERAGLRLASMETFGESYALTLKEWRRRFLGAWPEIEKLGFPPSFRRLWEYYLCYCEAGFRAGAIDVGLYGIVRAEGQEIGAA